MLTCKHCDSVAKVLGMCRPCYDKARRQDPVQLEKFREANRRYMATPKGIESQERGYRARRLREKAAKAREPF